MKRKSFLLLSFVVCSVLLTGWHVADTDKTSVKKSKEQFSSYLPDDDSALQEKNILSSILALNSHEKYKPKANFRTGHVTNVSLKNYFEKTEHGFSIKLPSHTNIPTPAVVNGSLVVSGGFGSKEYYSFDAITGQLKWGVHLDDDGPSSPAIEDNIIVFNTESCTIFACDLLTGKQIWSYWLGDPLMSMPTIANDIVFTSYPARYEGQPVRLQDDSLPTTITIFPTHVAIAFELKTGKILWQRWIDSDIMSAPVAKGDLLYITTFSGALYKIKQKTGEIIEAKSIRATSAPVFDNNNEIIVSRRSDNKRDSVFSETIVRGTGTMRRSFYKKQADYLDHRVQDKSELKKAATHLDAGNGFSGGAPASANWKAANDNIGQSNVASLQSFQGSRSLYYNGFLYNTMGDEIICTGTDGTVQWKYALQGDLKKQGGFIGTPPIYVNNLIIAATLNGEVLIINAKDGKTIKKYELKQAIRYQPIAEKGWIYVTTVDGRLHAINTGNPSITGWNMWGGNAKRTNTAKDS